MSDTDSITIPESGALTLSDAAWEEARRRAKIIGPLSACDTVPSTIATAAGDQLGLSSRTVYSLIRRYRESGGSVVSLAPTRSDGGRGGRRLPERTEHLIFSVINELYLSRQRFKIETVIKEIHRRCRMKEIKTPSANTVRARIRHLRPDTVLRAREGSSAGHHLKPVTGSYPEVSAPLESVQFDHTPVDVIIVDSVLRQPIGRPWITIGIDVYSRCITGFCLTLEPPSAVSVGLCLAHSVIDKQAWLERMGLETQWPVYGKPGHVYVDNAKEFHSEALRRGCEVHGIRISHRPVRAPHFGGIVERIIGTCMQMVHNLPGTTFSNVAERGSYDSDRKAALTLEELKLWFALAITGPYHGSVHLGINEPPISRWERGIREKGDPKPVVDPKAFLVDFLPVIRRRIQRHGFMVDHIAYFSNALTPWIAARDKGRKFLIRRDPRDLSRIWVLLPNENSYLEVAYRTLSNPAITLWEHRQAVARLRKAGRSKVDERAVFNAVVEMRDLAAKAGAKSRKARRANERRAHLSNPSQPVVQLPPVEPNSGLVPSKPFDDIEEW